MAEVGVDISRGYPKPWSEEIVAAADMIITMGCGDACPIFPGKRCENWKLPDPTGQGLDPSSARISALRRVREGEACRNAAEHQDRCKSAVSTKSWPRINTRL
ncbi:hypothetical protein KL953_22765 [Mycolicibacterium goodii]|nr:hypothetical protein [Mycolicibacterium goodii]MBU8828729.1 hypothetical protein [Mycolicibacterium goodii]